MGVPAYASDEALVSFTHLCSPLSDTGDHDNSDNGMDDILPHLLHDRLFYLAYAITGSSESTYSHQLWELFGTSNPGHLLTVYAALAATNGTPASSASSEPVDLDEYLIAAVEGVRRGGDGATRLSTADKPEDVSMESLLNMVTRRLDEPGTSPYDFVLRQVKSQLRLMKSEMAARFGVGKFANFHLDYTCQASSHLLACLLTIPVHRFRLAHPHSREVRPLFVQDLLLDPVPAALPRSAAVSRFEAAPHSHRDAASLHTTPGSVRPTWQLDDSNQSGSQPDKLTPDPCQGRQRW